MIDGFLNIVRIWVLSNTEAHRSLLQVYAFGGSTTCTDGRDASAVFVFTASIIVSSSAYWPPCSDPKRGDMGHGLQDNLESRRGTGSEGLWGHIGIDLVRSLRCYTQIIYNVQRDIRRRRAIGHSFSL